MSICQHDFTIERRFRQTPAQAFRAFADPQLKRRWFHVPDGWTDASWELDFRVGGRRSAIRTKTDTRSHVCSATGTRHRFQILFRANHAATDQRGLIQICSIG